MPTEVRVSEVGHWLIPELWNVPCDCCMSDLPLFSFIFLLYAALDLGDLPSGIPDPAGSVFRGDLEQMLPSLGAPTGLVLSRATVGFDTDSVQCEVAGVDADDDVDDMGGGNEVGVCEANISNDGDAETAELADICGGVLMAGMPGVAGAEDTGVVVVDAPMTSLPAEDNTVGVLEGESDLTTSCLDSTLLVPFVRLIFILRPLSTEET